MVIGIDPQLIEPKFNVRGHILMKEAQGAKRECQKESAFYEFKNCDSEQSSVVASVSFANVFCVSAEKANPLMSM